jgi:hypothetical protein
MDTWTLAGAPRGRGTGRGWWKTARELPDSVGEVALEAVGCLLRLLPSRRSLTRYARGAVDAGTGDSRAVHRAVELTVVAAVEPPLVAATGGGRDRGSAGLAGEAMASQV